MQLSNLRQHWCRHASHPSLPLHRRQPSTCDHGWCRHLTNIAMSMGSNLWTAAVGMSLASLPPMVRSSLFTDTIPEAYWTVHQLLFFYAEQEVHLCKKAVERAREHCVVRTDKAVSIVNCQKRSWLALNHWRVSVIITSTSVNIRIFPPTMFPPAITRIP